MQMEGSTPPLVAREIDILLERLFPICRSITGNGVRETLSIIGEHIPLKIHEVRTGTRAFDWKVPEEWNIRDAYIKGPSGEKIADFKKHNLHVVGYSTPIQATMTLEELKPHLHSLPESPDLIPHRTSYYNRAWGFCLADNVLKSLPEGNYEVVIDSTLKKGSLTYGEFFVPGKVKEEVLLTCYVCHPSMANDNLSGIALMTFLAKEMQKSKLHYSYRFVFAPETIGALVWLSRNKARIKRIVHGLVATCVGDDGSFTYKKSRRGNAEIDRIVAQVLKDSEQKHTIIDFFPKGSDERQYCAPGFNLPVGSLMRTLYYNYRWYHTSGDNLSVVKGIHIEGTLALYKRVIDMLEKNRTYKNLQPYGEPQLGKRGLYDSLGGKSHEGTKDAMLWVLNLSDGKHSLVDIAERSKLKFEDISKATDLLLKHKLLRKLR